jgi:hypothetical protein
MHYVYLLQSEVFVDQRYVGREIQTTETKQKRRGGMSPAAS